MELFEFVGAIFDSPEKFRDIPNNIKERHFFMTMRFLSIKHPVEVNAYNHIAVNKLNVLTYFNAVMHRQYKSVPPWIKTPTNKSDKKKQTDYPKEVLHFYMRDKQISQKDFDFYREMFPEESNEILDKIKKMLAGED